PNSGLTDWGPLAEVPASGFLVLTARFGAGGSLTPIDAVVSGEGATAGQISIKVPSSPTADDQLLVIAIRLDADHEPTLLLMDPLLPGSAQAYEPGTQSQQPDLWYWAFDLQGISSGITLHIPEAAGSGAARIFDNMRFVFESMATRWPGKEPLRLL